MSNILLIEQETIFNYNRGEDYACIYTHEPSLKRRLKKLNKEHPSIFNQTRDNGEGGLTYELPKTLICIRKPCSEQRKQAAREAALKSGRIPPKNRANTPK